jgi:hypothetical protein
VDLSAPWKEDDFLAPLATHAPGLAEEVRGIAEGSGMSLREVVALSFLIDLGTAGSACTGVAFARGPDGPVVGKTSDCTPGVQQEWLRPRKVKPIGELAAITHSHVGTPNAEMGMNEAGLCIGISGMLSRATDRGGVGWQQDIRAVLHACATTRDAIAMLERIPIRHAGYAMVIGDAAGDVAVVEKVVGQLAVRRPAPGSAPGSVAVYEANIGLCPETAPFIDPGWCNENGYRRTALLASLLDGGGWSDYSLRGMIDLFCTHAEPAGLCQHGPQLHSQTGFFMLPQKRQMWLARGHTCRRDFEVVGF